MESKTKDTAEPHLVNGCPVGSEIAYLSSGESKECSCGQPMLETWVKSYQDHVWPRAWSQCRLIKMDVSIRSWAFFHRRTRTQAPHGRAQQTGRSGRKTTWKKEGKVGRFALLLSICINIFNIVCVSGVELRHCKRQGSCWAASSSVGWGRARMVGRAVPGSLKVTVKNRCSVQQ